jgi:hypothetical protein
VAYELLAGEHPFARRSSLEANLERMQVRDIAGLTVRQNAAIRRALAFDRQQRTPSVAEFMHELGAPRNLLSSDGTTRSDRSDLNKAKRRGGRRSVFIFASLAIVFAVGGAYIYQSRAEVAQREAAERANAAEASLAANRAAEQERLARVRAEEERLEIERRLEAERQARAAAEDAAQEAQIKADREREARRRDQERARAEARARREHEALREQAAAEQRSDSTPAGSVAIETKPRPGTIYRWQDRSGKVNYGAVVPDEYTFTAVPMTPNN